jgi:hypothetical protein
VLDTLTTTWKVARRLGRSGQQDLSGPTRFAAQTTPVWGHGRALLDDPGALLEAARSQLGPAFRLDLPEASLIVAGGEAGRALATRPRALGQQRFVLQELGGELRWWTLPTLSEADLLSLQATLTPARCRAPIERAARRLSEQIESWPRRGRLLPLLEHSLPAVLAATLVTPGRAEATGGALLRFASTAVDAPQPLSPWPAVPWRRDPARRRYDELARGLQPQAVERRSRRREATSLLGTLAGELGPASAARIAAVIAGTTWHSALAQLRSTVATSINELLLEELLEEHDLLHGDQGDVTFESATRSVALTRHLEQALDGALAAPRAWQLARLEADLGCSNGGFARVSGCWPPMGEGVAPQSFTDG